MFCKRVNFCSPLKVPDLVALYPLDGAHGTKEQALPVVFKPPQDQMENLMALMNFLELLTATLSFRTVAA